MSTARASAGTVAWPFGLPGRGSVATLRGVGVVLGVGDGLPATDGSGTTPDATGATNVGGVAEVVPQEASIAPAARADPITRRIRTGGCYADGSRCGTRPA